MIKTQNLRRKLIQLYAALLYNAHLKGFVKGDIFTGLSKTLCVPGLNCYSCPGAIAACPLGALQNALAVSGHRLPWYMLGILLLQGIILGRTICGWLCPAGLIQELLYRIPVPKIAKSRVTRRLSWLKYAVLAVFVIGLPLIWGLKGNTVPAFCKYLCPAGTLEGAIGLLANPANSAKFSMLGDTFVLKFIILILILLACLVLYRAFCRFLCPLGAIYSLFSKLCIVGVKVDSAKCVDCGLCIRKCKMDVRHVGDRECIHCGECIPVCQAKAISLKAGRIVLMKNECGNPPDEKQIHRRRFRSAIIWALALLLLLGVGFIVNRSEDAAVQKDTSVQTEAAVDNGPDFTLPLYGEEGGTFSLKAHRGQLVVLNFWATWCPACVEELPHFERLQKEYGDRIAVLAIHSELKTDDVPAFIAQQGLSLSYADDSDGSVIAMYEGSTMLPQTVILDTEGNVVINQVGSVSYEQLQSWVEPLLGETKK